MTGNDALVGAHAIDAIAAVRGYRVRGTAEAARRGLRLVTISPSVLVPVSPHACLVIGPVGIRLMIPPSRGRVIARGGCSGGALRMSGPWPSPRHGRRLPPRRRLRSARRPCADPDQIRARLLHRSPLTEGGLIRSDPIVDLGGANPGKSAGEAGATPIDGGADGAYRSGTRRQPLTVLLDRPY
jgi:hypothetical protein